MAMSFGVPAADETGREVYGKWCAGCHVDSPFAPGTVALAANRGAEKSVITERDDLTAPFVRAMVRNGFAGMPSFRRTEIGEPELDALVRFLTKP